MPHVSRGQGLAVISCITPALAAKGPHGALINELGQATDGPWGYWRDPGQSGE